MTTKVERELSKAMMTLISHVRLQTEGDLEAALIMEGVRLDVIKEAAAPATLGCPERNGHPHVPENSDFSVCSFCGGYTGKEGPVTLIEQTSKT